MIKILKKNNSEPYRLFHEYYERAILKNQYLVEAIAISSFDSFSKEVESRFVNLKYIDDDKWIFFTNYKSIKSQNFEGHNQISCLFYWESINVQIRIKARIAKCSHEFSDLHFKGRSDSKNALAISSNQSRTISSYNTVIKNYNDTLKDKILISKRPDYWGGYEFMPYYFEFWEGHESRLNKRIIFELKDGLWAASLLQP